MITGKNQRPAAAARGLLLNYHVMQHGYGDKDCAWCSAMNEMDADIARFEALIARANQIIAESGPIEQALWKLCKDNLECKTDQECGECD